MYELIPTQQMFKQFSTASMAKRKELLADIIGDRAIVSLDFFDVQKFLSGKGGYLVSFVEEGCGMNDMLGLQLTGLASKAMGCMMPGLYCSLLQFQQIPILRL